MREQYMYKVQNVPCQNAKPMMLAGHNREQLHHEQYMCQVHLQYVMAAVERQFGIQHSAPDAKSLQEEPEAVALIHAVDEEQHLALQQAQLQQYHHDQQLVLPASHDTALQCANICLCC